MTQWMDIGTVGHLAKPARPVGVLPAHLHATILFLGYNQQQATYSQLALSADKAVWVERIAKDELEKVIEEVIILKRHRNEELEDILNIASRNTRNNNNHLQGLIKYEDYQLNRNQIAYFLLQLVKP